MIHVDEYRDWKNHPVTEAFFQSVSGIKEQLDVAIDSGALDERPAVLVKYLGQKAMCVGILAYKPDFNSDGYMINAEGGIIE